MAAIRCGYSCCICKGIASPRSRGINTSHEDVKRDVNELRLGISELHSSSQSADQRLDNRKVSEFLRSLYSHSYTERKDENPSRIEGTCN